VNGETVSQSNCAADGEDELDAAYKMACQHAERYDRTADPADLALALDWQQRLVDGQDTPLPGDLVQLSLLLRERAATSGAADQQADRRAALAAADRALAMIASDDPAQPEVLGLVGQLRIAADELDPVAGQADRAIVELKGAVSCLPPDHPYRAELRVSLGLALLAGTRRKSTLRLARSAVEDLRTALEIFEEVAGDALAEQRRPDPQTLYIACMAGIAGFALAQLIHESAPRARGIAFLEYGLAHADGPGDDRLRAMVAGFLGLALLEEGYRWSSALDTDRIAGLLEAGIRDEDDPVRATALRRALREVAVVLPLSTGQGDPDAAVEMMRGWLDAQPEGSIDRIAAAINLSMALYQRYLRTGVLGDLDLAVDYAWQALQWADRGAPDFVVAVLALVAALALRLPRNPRPLDVERLPEVLTLVRQASASVGDSSPYTPRLAEAHAALLIAAPPGRIASADRVAHAVDQLVKAAAVESNPYERAYLGIKAAGLAGAQALLGVPDRVAMERALGALRVERDGPRGAQATSALGALLWQAYRTFGNVGYLTEGIRTLEELDPGTGGLFDDPYQAMNVLAEAYRAAVVLDAGYAAASRRAGLAALAGHTRRVLLQEGVDDSLATATTVARQALMVAGWCVRDGEPEQAIAALETGRGLVLYAATTGATVPELLRQRGAEALAAEWETARPRGAYGLAAGWDLASGATVLPDELRRRTLAVLDQEGRGGPGLVRPPTAADIQRALRAVDGDALCYLLPRSPHGPGCALVVRRDGAPQFVPLPDLDGDAEPVRTYWAALREDADSDAAAAVAAWSDWAWPAVMGPLLRELRNAGARAEPRVVLVGVGDRSELPWAAARRVLPDGAMRYAVEDAVISTVPTARLLCQLAGRGYLPLDGTALVVDDPYGNADLAAAALEADSVRSQFYPAESVTSGAGTSGAAASVLAALPGGTAPRPVVHLAGHAHLVPGRPVDAAVQLPGGIALTVRDVLDQARRMPADAPGPLVDLAACTSGVSGGQYDEALSLAAAFLVAGATGAVGTLWAVTDRRSAALQYLFHHNLVRAGMPPAAALREAQLAFLRPGPLPAAMPSQLRLPAGRAIVNHPVFWAAFALHGH
jgi:CHAT domain-containing protein